MSRNDADDYARQLYARIPGHYRVYDQEQGFPLLALLRVVSEQVASVRQDLDDLWDNFFIETGADWVVPYLGALVGTNLLAHPVGQSNRLEVWNTIRWRRSRGTPAMLQELAQDISGWPANVVEFFQALGWSQNLYHLRLTHPLTPDLRDTYALSLLGRAADPLAHAADFKVVHPLDQARVSPGSLAAGPVNADALGIGRAAWGTPGRYQIKHLGVFVRRLQTFALSGVIPAAVDPGAPNPVNPPYPACFTFDPLHRHVPLFAAQSASPITRAAFQHAPWEAVGSDIDVRQFGISIAAGGAPVVDLSSSSTAFTFAGAGKGIQLHASTGMRLMERYRFQQGAAHFLVHAIWQQTGGSTTLGTLSTLLASRRDGSTLEGSEAYRQGSQTPGAGALQVTIECGAPTPDWPTLPYSPPGRFPGAVLAVRSANAGPWHDSDACYIYLPAAFVQPGAPVTFWVADDGSTYTSATFTSLTLARGSAGQVYPARASDTSVDAELGYTILRRTPGAMRVADIARFGTPVASALFEVGVFTGTPQRLGAVATVAQPKSAYPQLDIPNPWPAFTYGRDLTTPDGLSGLLYVHVTKLEGATDIPPTELIISSRDGRVLLVYLPEVPASAGSDMWLFVATDGSTYLPTPGAGGTPSPALAGTETYEDLPLARAAQGQTLAITGIWPLQQRRAVGINLCRCERHTLLWPGELGIDPELGVFAFAPDDPAVAYALSQPDPAIPSAANLPNPLIPQYGLSVDYVEAFGDRVGARTFDQHLDPAVKRLVALVGDAYSAANPAIQRDHIHASVADALAAAQDDDVIEIADSATYPVSAPIQLPAGNPPAKRLTLRAAAGQRPCLTFYSQPNTPTTSSLQVTAPMDALELSGLLLSGGPILLDAATKHLNLAACTLDPRSAIGSSSLAATDTSLQSQASYQLCRCISGGMYLAAGVSQVTVADSIVDVYGTLAIGGAQPGAATPLSQQPAAQGVHLERVTVFGGVRCDVLEASECLFDDLVVVDDQQAGCVLFSRFEIGSVLPRRYQCIPTSAQASLCAASSIPVRCFAPLFNSRRFGRPDYAQLAAACPQQVLTASEQGSEVGAFAGALNPIRLQNLTIKLSEFLPVGLSAVVVAET